MGLVGPSGAAVPIRSPTSGRPACCTIAAPARTKRKEAGAVPGSDLGQSQVVERGEAVEVDILQPRQATAAAPEARPGRVKPMQDRGAQASGQPVEPWHHRCPSLDMLGLDMLAAVGHASRPAPRRDTAGRGGGARDGIMTK